MCGIAGIVDLAQKRPVPAGALRAMADAILHRGPDEDGFLERPGLGLASRRLSIVGLADGRQPISNEDGSISVVFNGELFDFPEVRGDLECRGHVFRTHCDTEIIPHLWEEDREKLFDRLRGQFAFALWDERRQELMLARDRFGICPLYWARIATAGGDWLLFASEVKALLASGMVPARPDPRGINHVFTFFALPGPVTCFEGVHCLLPGHYLHLHLGSAGGTRPTPVEVRDRSYFTVDFPDRGEEEWGGDPRRLTDELETRLFRAVEKRLRADVQVVSYLSGGVDSGLVATVASHVRGEALPTFTIRIKEPRFDEAGRAALVAGKIGSDQTIIPCGPEEILGAYPEVIEAAEGPVIEPATAALFLMAREVHRQGFKVALTGEGADEWLAGYPWYKTHKLTGWLDALPGLPLGQIIRRLYLRLTGAPRVPWSVMRRNLQALDGPNGWLDIYGIMGLSKLRFYSAEMQERLADHFPLDDLGLDAERMRRWHPLHRGLYLGARIMLPGLLLHARGDRVAMHSSVETRYPFLDEDVFTFLAKLHPRWKLHGLRDKHLLRLLAARWLPEEVAQRPKAIFRAPFNSFHLDACPGFVDQLLSEESLKRTGYFDVAAVQSWRQRFRQMRQGSLMRMSVEMGLVGVLTTQLWHHTFIGGSLAELRSVAPATQRAAA